MNKINFEPVIEYIDTKIDEFELRLKADIVKKFDQVLFAIDTFAKNNKNNEADIKVLSHKTERIEHWVIKSAKKTKIAYKP